MKKLASLFVVLMLPVLLFAGGGAQQQRGGERDLSNFNPTGYPIVNERISFRVAFNANPMVPADLNTQYLSQKAERITNIRIDWISIPNAGWTERKNLMLATGDLPDIWDAQLNADDLTRYGRDGTFIRMNELIRDYAPNFRNLYNEMPGLEALITAPDGNQYGIARVNSGPWMPLNGVGIINQMWLDRLGLAMPRTIDEFYNVLVAFRDRDPNGNGRADEIPMAFHTAGASTIIHNGGFSWLISSFGLALGGAGFNEHYVGIVNGRVVNQATRPEFREAISFISRLYREGLVDMEGFTLSEAEFAAKLNAEPGIIGYTQLWDINDTISNPTNNQAFAYMRPLAGPGGRRPLVSRTPMPGTFRGWGVITRVNQHPEAAMRWIDYHYDEDNSIEMIEGPFGVRVLPNPDGTVFVRPPPPGMSVAEDRFTHCRAGFLAMPVSAYRNRLRLPSTDLKVSFLDMYLDMYSEPYPMMPVYYTLEQGIEMAQLQIDMRQYIERMTSEWIMNGRIDAEWNAYLAEIERVGQARWLSIKQEAYDRFMAAL